MDWAILMQRTFGFEALNARNAPRKCASSRALTDAGEVKKILSHLRLPTSPLPRGPARDPRWAGELRLRGRVARSARGRFRVRETEVRPRAAFSSARSVEACATARWTLVRAAASGRARGRTARVSYPPVAAFVDACRRGQIPVSNSLLLRQSKCVDTRDAFRYTGAREERPRLISLYLSRHRASSGSVRSFGSDSEDFVRYQQKASETDAVNAEDSGMIALGSGVVIAGKYALERVIASGGMGSIWVARHRELDVDITVKFMAPALVGSAEMRTRFEREARVAARLRSQHVVQILDYGVESGTPYIAMELLTGESLADRLKRQGRLPLSAVRPLLIQICKALRTAHEAGLVHRDLKPGNIFLAVKDEDEVVKILDFGIAKVTDTSAEAQEGTGTGVILGSAHYMSPEQIRSSRQVDHRSDLWSLGVIMYRVLTGKLPFSGSVVGDVMVRICIDPCPLASTVVPDLPASLNEWFARIFERDVEKRFQSAKEVAEAFSAMAYGQSQRTSEINLPAWVPSPSSLAVSPLEPTAPLPPPKPPMASAADGPTFATPAMAEPSAGTRQVVTKPPPQDSGPPADPRSRGVPTRPAAVSRAIMVGLLVLVACGILAVVVAIRWNADSRGPVAASAKPEDSAPPPVENPTAPEAEASQARSGLEAPLPGGTGEAARPNAVPTGVPNENSTAPSTSVAPAVTAAAGEKRGPSNPTNKPVKPKMPGPMEKEL